MHEAVNLLDFEDMSSPSLCAGKVYFDPPRILGKLLSRQISMRGWRFVAFLFSLGLLGTVGKG